MQSMNWDDRAEAELAEHEVPLWRAKNFTLRVSSKFINLLERPRAAMAPLPESHSENPG
jgi:hypothetical protein